MRIIGWTYEADYHCNDCAKLRFGFENLDNDTAIDNEGNKAHPIFSIDEIDENTVCGDCFEPIN